MARCQGFFDFLENEQASYLPRVGGLRGDRDLAVSALSGLSPRATVASRLGRAYSMIRSKRRVGRSRGQITWVWMEDVPHPKNGRVE